MDNKAMDNGDGEVIGFMDGELYGMDGWTDTPSVIFCYSLFFVAIRSIPRC
jgi:hypothetical protein